MDADAAFEAFIDLERFDGLAGLHEEIGPLVVIVLVGRGGSDQFFVQEGGFGEEVVALVDVGQEFFIPLICGIDPGRLFGEVEGVGVAVLVGVDARQLVGGGMVLAILFEQFLQEFGGLFVVAKQAIFIGFDVELLVLYFLFGKTAVLLGHQGQA